MVFPYSIEENRFLKFLLKEAPTPAALVEITATFEIRRYISRQMCFIIRSLNEVNQVNISLVVLV